MEPDEPPRKNYDFKERAFQRDNPVGADVPPMPTTKELAMMAGPATPKSAAGPATLNGGANRTADPNDVYVLLQENRAVEQRGGFDEIEIKRVRSRRKRDYWLLLITGNGLMAIATFLGSGNPFFLVCGIAAMALFTASFTWIMWHIMDKY